MIVRNRFVFVFFVVMNLTASWTAYAQPGGGGDPGNGQPVPIPFAWLLVAAGGALGVRTLLKKNDKRN